MSDDDSPELLIARIMQQRFLAEHGPHIAASKPSWAVPKADNVVSEPDHEGTLEVHFHSEQLLPPGPNDAVVFAAAWYNPRSQMMLVEEPILSVGFGPGNDVVQFANAAEARQAADDLRRAADEFEAVTS